jgi:hypothetical protein
MSEILESLFGSKERARLLRFFLQNPEKEFDFKEVVRRNMLNSQGVKRELNKLLNIRFISKRSHKGELSYALNQNFNYYPELKNLIAKSNVYPQCQSLARVKNLGMIKFAAISGVFINYPKSKADMIIVGDGISRGRLKNLMNSLEAEIGKEINFVLMTGEELKYRLNMLDKFLLEFFEGPHEELVNKVPGLKQFIARQKQ